MISSDLQLKCISLNYIIQDYNTTECNESLLIKNWLKDNYDQIPLYTSDCYFRLLSHFYNPIWSF